MHFHVTVTPVNMPFNKDSISIKKKTQKVVVVLFNGIRTNVSTDYSSSQKEEKLAHRPYASYFRAAASSCDKPS